MSDGGAEELLLVCVMPFEQTENGAGRVAVASSHVPRYYVCTMDGVALSHMQVGSPREASRTNRHCNGWTLDPSTTLSLSLSL